MSRQNVYPTANVNVQGAQVVAPGYQNQQQVVMPMYPPVRQVLMPSLYCAIAWPILMGVGLVVFILGLVLMIKMHTAMFTMLIAVGAFAIFIGAFFLCVIGQQVRLAGNCKLFFCPCTKESKTEIAKIKETQQQNIIQYQQLNPRMQTVAVPVNQVPMTNVNSAVEQHANYVAPGPVLQQTQVQPPTHSAESGEIKFVPM